MNFGNTASSFQKIEQGQGQVSRYNTIGKQGSRNSVSVMFSNLHQNEIYHGSMDLVQKHGSGSTEARKHGSTEAQKHGSTEARKHGSMEAHKHRSTEAWQQRSAEARSESELVLASNPGAIPGLGRVLGNGQMLALHRLQPLPHASDSAGIKAAKNNTTRTIPNMMPFQYVIKIDAFRRSCL